MLGVECINKCVLVVNEVIHMLVLISLLLKFDKAYLCKTFSVAVLFFFSFFLSNCFHNYSFSVCLEVLNK